MPRSLEKHLQASLEAELRARGWLYVHHRDSIGTIPGWPDVFAVRGTRAVAIEVKTAAAVNRSGVRLMLSPLSTRCRQGIALRGRSRSSRASGWVRSARSPGRASTWRRG